jgi:WD40 repeat protein
MLVLQAGDSVIRLQFLPDGRRLLAWLLSAQRVVNLDVWTLPAGGRVRLPVPRLGVDSWWNSAFQGHAVAVHPSGESCYVAWEGQLFAFRTTDGTPQPVPEGVRANQAILSPGGDRLLAADLTHGRRQLAALTVDASGDTVVWRRPQPPQFRHVAGFLPDGERFVTISDRVCINRFATGDEQAATRYPAGHAYQPQLSPDGRHLGVIGYGSMYLFDTAALGKPRRITSTRTYGNFISFAFHPDGRTLAVIHGGPTLVKIYDLETLRLVRKYNWKLGPLASVAFSPDGMLGAAGSRDGRIVLWDVDP